LNAEVAEVYDELVDRSLPDIGANRSVWQRTMSLIHALRGRKICNIDGAKLGLKLTLGLTLPIDGSTYKECALFEIPDMVRIYGQSVVGGGDLTNPHGAHINLKPDLSILGDLTGVFQETDSQITGFDSTPDAKALARFLFGPPNQFVAGMSKPPVTADGHAITDLEPYALFAMEVKHPKAGGLSFLEAGKPLLTAFETTELVESVPDPTAFLPGTTTYKLPDGYMFAELLNVFHMHWGSRRTEPCDGKLRGDLPPNAPAAGMVPTCTQSIDPNGKNFSYQTDLHSYEQLLAEVFTEDKFINALHDAALAMKEVNIDGKDGVTILGDFVQILLAPDAKLTYRDGRTSAQTNLGEDVGYVSPMYLLLDGLKQIDKNFENPALKDAHDTWLSARSDVVDLFLSIEDNNGKKRLKDRVGRGVFLRAVEFLRDRVKAHQDAGDSEDWGNNLAPRLVKFMDTPLVAGALGIVDKSWQEKEAGAQLMKFVSFLVNEQTNPAGFEATVVAAADLFQLMQDSPKIAPLLHLLAEAVAPGVTDAVAKGGNNYSANDGILRRVVELTNEVVKVHKRRPSTFSRVLRNAVSNSMPDKGTPLEAMIDAITEVERIDASKPNNAPLNRDDLGHIATSAYTFMSDDQHGLERLYSVIQHRELHPKKQEPQQAPQQGQGQ
jgi:hypothetical protein